MQEGQPKLLRFTMLDIIEQFSRQKEKKIIIKKKDKLEQTNSASHSIGITRQIFQTAFVDNQNRRRRIEIW